MPIIMILVMLFAGNFAGRMVYCHVAEFLPAKAEWEAAHARHDMVGMWTAFDKEMKAAKRGTDVLWFWH